MRRLLVLAVAALSLWLAPGAFAAGWCGSGEASTNRPDIVTGPQVHVVVATPADGADGFATDSGKLADDIASIQAWWAGQDATRTPRFDLATFPSGPCLDISFVRLPQAAAALASDQTLFETLGGDVAGAERRSAFEKYLIYYEGPALPQPAPGVEICGVGGGQVESGPAFAVVILAGCPGVPTDAIAAHELLHALGAVPPGDPNPSICPGDPGHPCDSPTDVLYPYSSGGALSSLVLDYNHDDYYGHAPGWPDVRDSAWLRHLDAPQFPLAVTFNGAGSVSSDAPGVDCTASCTTQWDQGSHPSLLASGAAGTRFIRWRGACTGPFSCQLTLNQAESVTAVFGPVRIPVRVATTGKGRVVCTPSCSKSFPAGSSLELRAVAAKGWRFAAWGGACKGRRLVCSPVTDFALSVHALFRRR